MKLGFFLRKKVTFILKVMRDSLDLSYYLVWLLIDPSKFKFIKTEKIKNLLVMYGGAVGDTYSAVGILNSFTEKYPAINVYYLTKEKCKKYAHNPKINLINLKDAKQMIDKKEIDAVVMLQSVVLENEIFDKTMYFKLLKIPYRAVCDNMHLSTFHKHLPVLATRKVYSVNTNGFEDHLKCFRLLGFNIDRPQFYNFHSQENFISKFRKIYHIRKREKLIFFHVGGGTIIKALEEQKVPSHLWPEENWVAIAEQILHKYDSRIIFTGTDKESDLVNNIISRLQRKNLSNRVISLVNKNTIEETYSLINQGDLLITIDTGTAHIAAQTGIPIIDLFGPVSPKWCKPISNNCTSLFHSQGCAICRKYYCPEANPICMKSITVREVSSHVDRILMG